jgi:RNA polymerase-interacting CarD/CdnL/TRCF family regulator
MKFKVGAGIVHPDYGLGHITAIEEKQFSDIEACRYYKIAFPKLNIWVPIEAQAAIGLRLVTAKRDLDKYRNVIKGRPVLFNGDLPKGHEELAGRLKKGSFQTLCEIVRDLTVSGWQKPLGVSVKTILRKTQERLYQEWATAAGISIAEATKEIDTLLEETHEVTLE